VVGIGASLATGFIPFYMIDDSAKAYKAREE